MLLDRSQSYVIIGNYGNDTLALVQWAYENGLSNVQVVSVDTGWAGEDWLEHVAQVELWLKTQGFIPVRLLAVPNFSELMQQRQDFPTPKFQWCANVLKGSTLLKWLDHVDPAGEYQLMLGHRRASARSKQNLPESIPESSTFGERAVWYPLIDCSTEERNRFIHATGFPILTHRSLECDPCVNSTLVDYARLSPRIQARLKQLENKLEKKMFDFPEDTQDSATKKINVVSFDVLENMGCGDPYGCGI